jgi:hypothetical protein
MHTRRAAHAAGCSLILVLTAVNSTAEENTSDSRQSLADAWWTGPIMAASAGTLSKGHFLVEPYVFDVISQGSYDEQGDRHGGERTHGLGSFTYINYGLTDRITIGAIPRLAFNDVSHGEDSSSLRLGDLSVQAQYGLTRFREGSRIPTLAVNIEQRLPTGRYDRLGSRMSDGAGAGAYTTTLSLYSQYFLWMPNGRVVRTRLNLSYGFSDNVNVQDESVYGTNAGFRGRAAPGASFSAISAWEYSLTRNWVLALDVAYQHNETTKVDGIELPGGNIDLPPTRVQFQSGSRETLSLAPAVEYNWTSRIGVIVGAVITASGRNAGASFAPVTAVNMVF